MKNIPAIFARLAALYKLAKQWNNSSELRQSHAKELLQRWYPISNDLRGSLPELYCDLPTRIYPSLGDYNVRVREDLFIDLFSDIDYALEVRANSEIGVTEFSEMKDTENLNRVFVSHGRSNDWREVQDYIEKDLSFLTLELAQEPNLGRTIFQKLEEESKKCSFAVIVMTGDDADVAGAPRARENVIHEIGYFQAKYGPSRLCLLHEEGTNIPSNIHGIVYIPFPKSLVSASFSVLGRELNAALKTI